MRKRCLFILRHGPYGTQSGREGLEALLVAAAFDQAVSLLLLDDGVLHLLKNQNDGCGVKDCSPTFRSLPLYDVETVWVDAVSLRERGLALEDLLIPVELVDGAALPALLAHQDCVLSF